MGWKDGLRPASFRGVPFKVPGHEASYGRRGPLNEYPERDLPFFDDMGRRARQYQIEAYVLGDDYMAQRDALIGACEQKGPGTLVHFYLGSKTVVCIEAHLQESVDEGRMARFRLVFVEAGEAAYPSAQLDTRATVSTAGKGVLTAAGARLQQVLNVAGSGFLVQQATALVVSAGAKILAEITGLQGTGQLFAQAVSSVQTLANTATTLVKSPASLGTQLLGSIVNMAGLGAAPALLLDSSARLATFGTGLPTVKPTTPARVQQAANQDVLTSSVRRAAIVNAATATSSQDYASYPDAVAARDRVTGLLESEIAIAGATGDDAGFTALKTLQAAAARDLTVRAASLARVLSYTPRATLPALVIAYTLYADAARADELVARNHIPHPGFVPGGVPLEVLAAA